MGPMVDIDLFVKELRARGHRVENVTSIPANAGGYELTVDGEVLDLSEAENLLASDEDASS